jgi:probable F420-dependent oxidoreductase
MTSPHVKYGLQISFAHRPDEVVAQAVRAEQLGFDGVWIGEHFFRPAELDPAYPYKAHQPLRSGEECFDSMIVAGAIASATSTLNISTAVYLLPLRHPLVAARSIATTQILSNGRLRVGVGLGWAHEEYEGLEIPYKQRGSRLDEGMEIVSKALAGGPFDHSGRHFKFKALSIVNHPVKVPLLAGGAAEPALRRAARLADGWATPPYNMTFDDCVSHRSHLEGLRLEYGTTNRRFDYYVRLPNATPELVRKYAEAGFTNLTVGGGQVVKWPDPLERKIAFIEETARQLGIRPKR